MHCYHLLSNKDCPKILRYDVLITIIYILVLIFGLVNNGLSLLVFYNKKYNNRLLSMLMRYYYISNIFSIFTSTLYMGILLQLRNRCLQKIAFYKNLEISLRVLTIICTEMSYTILALSAFARFLYSAKPPLFRSALAKATRRAGIVLVGGFLAVTLCSNIGHFWDNSNEASVAYRNYMVLYVTGMMAVNALFNILAIGKERRGKFQSTNTGAGRITSMAVVTRLNKWLTISSVLSVVITMPTVVIGFVPASMSTQPITISYCNGLFFPAYTFTSLLLCIAMCVDNTVFCIICKAYREEMIAATRNCLRCRSCKEIGKRQTSLAATVKWDD